jgi:hypothetical protein
MLTLEQIRVKAPSVFAEVPYNKMSDKYNFFPTSKVVEGLMQNGFQPTYAAQSRTRIEGKENFTRHILRFRHEDMNQLTKGDEVPEIVITNSHDGTSAYRIALGIFRMVCSNGLMVQSANFNDIKVRHSGGQDAIHKVIEGTYEVIKEAPQIAAQLQEWKGITLNHSEQVLLANTALELQETSLIVQPESLLRPRRWDDKPVNDNNDLWKTFNTIQENIIKGGVFGVNDKGQSRRLRAVKSIDKDQKLNKALWSMTEHFAALKNAA